MEGGEEEEESTTTFEPPPEGVQVDVEFSVLDGWTEHLRQPYSSTLSREGDELVPTDAEYVCLGAVDNTTGKIILCAFGKTSEVFKVTSDNGTTEHNGVFFYRQHGSSCGFAPTSSISLGAADTTDYGDDKRLSWHLANGGGWRAGSNTGLDSSSEIDRSVRQECETMTEMSESEEPVTSESQMGEY